MKRKLLFLLLSSLLAALFVPTVNGQWCPPNAQLGCVVNQNLNIVDSLSRTYRVRQLSADIENMIWNSAYGAYGYYDGGQFIPVRQGPRGPIGKRESAAWGAGVGAAIGGAAAGNWRGMVGGAGAGTLVGLILGGRGKKSQAPEIAAQENTAAQQEAAEEQKKAERWAIVNRSGQVAKITRGYRPLVGKVLDPGESLPSGIPDVSWAAVMLAPTSGGVSAIQAEVRSLGRRGWEIIVPAEEVLQ